MTAYTLNNDLHGIEVTFDTKPSETIRNMLKDAGFRWHKYKKLWYAKQSPAREEVARQAVAGAEQAIDYSDWTGTTSAGYMGATKWIGSNARKGLYGAELSKAIRDDLKAHGVKGVTIRSNRSGWSDNITATITIDKDDILDPSQVSYGWNNNITVYHANDKYKGVFSDRVIEKIRLVDTCLSSYVYDDSNAMVDYFNCSMYYHIDLKVKGVK